MQGHGGYIGYRAFRKDWKVEEGELAVSGKGITRSILECIFEAQAVESVDASRYDIESIQENAHVLIIQNNTALK